MLDTGTAPICPSMCSTPKSAVTLVNSEHKVANALFVKTFQSKCMHECMKLMSQCRFHQKPAERKDKCEACKPGTSAAFSLTSVSAIVWSCSF